MIIISRYYNTYKCMQMIQIVDLSRVFIGRYLILRHHNYQQTTKRRKLTCWQQVTSIDHDQLAHQSRQLTIVSNSTIILLLVTQINTSYLYNF